MSRRLTPFEARNGKSGRKMPPMGIWLHVALFALTVTAVGVLAKWDRTWLASRFGRRSVISRSDLVRALSSVDASMPGAGDRSWSGLPGLISIPGQSAGKPDQEAIVQYTFDASLQSEVEAIFRQYLPDHGALAAIDPQTGRILALVSHERRGRSSQGATSLDDNLALRATFPAASVFKVVTAAAAIAEQRFSADTRVAFNGSNHTLYRSNVLKDSTNRWTRHVSLRDAFAQSINTVFGKIGAFSVGAEKLRDYASRFGFNREIASDLPVQPGRAQIEANADAWSLAETASGFTRETTMSPLQGALIAASIVNDGRLMQPHAVESVHLPDGELVYRAEIGEPALTVPPEVASELRELMRQTVVSGTSRKSFRGFFRGQSSTIDAGGKTGSLTGYDPPGKYDWFVGFGRAGGRSIALAALTIHKEQWRVKSSYVARRAIEHYLLGH